MSHVLYYTPGTCSLAVNIVLREAGVPFELVRVDLRRKKLATGEDYYAVNPSGLVPALRLPDGTTFTETAVMIQYVADLRPDTKLAPPAGTMERYRLQERINFIATELHKGMGPLYNTLANDDYKTSLRNQLTRRWQVLADNLRDCSLMGTYTVADSYAFYVLRAWLHAHKQDLTRWPALVDYYAHLSARPAVIAALESEGLKA